MTGEKDLDALLLVRYATLVAVCELLPLPLVDTWLQNRLRRRMTQRIAERYQVFLDPKRLSILADANSGGCAGMVWAILLSPLKKLVKTVAFVFQVKAVADQFSETLHHALLIEEAARLRLLPNGAQQVRRAMDAAFTHVDVRVVERRLFGALRDRQHTLHDAVRESAELARRRFRGPSADDLADAAESGSLPRIEELGKVLEATVRVPGLVPELIRWFHAELGVLSAAPGEPSP